MTDSFIKTTHESGVMTVTIDRQDKLNALNREVIRQLQSAIEIAASDGEVRCVVITGAGNRAFVAGADIAELRSQDAESIRKTAQRGHQLMNLVEDLGKPVIAAINGFALGGGCELALACHLRFAASTAQIGLPEVQLGLMPGYGGTQRLSRLVGKGRALEMMLTGKPVNAEQARDCGLVNRIVEPEKLMDETLKLAARLASSAPLAMKGILAAVLEGTNSKLATGLEIEADLFSDLFKTNDMREGTAAFLEKRKAEFKGS